MTAGTAMPDYRRGYARHQHGYARLPAGRQHNTDLVPMGAIQPPLTARLRAETNAIVPSAQIFTRMLQPAHVTAFLHTETPCCFHCYTHIRTHNIEPPRAQVRTKPSHLRPAKRVRHPPARSQPHSFPAARRKCKSVPHCAAGQCAAPPHAGMRIISLKVDETFDSLRVSGLTCNVKRCMLYSY